MITETPHDRSLSATAAALRVGTLGVGELLDECLDRIDATEGDVHAWACLSDRDELHRRASRLQQTLTAGASPLHGIPFGVKDMIDTVDLPTEGGSLVFAGRRPDRDATCVTAALEVGGLMIGKTHTHEFAFGVRTPQTNNPWELARTPGGSSGGSAAAVAGGTALWALGTDTLGSVRMPAALCGVVGLKPTHGAVAIDGVLPLSPSLDVVGVLTPTVQDAAAAFAAVRRRDLPPVPPAAGSLRVGVLDSRWWGPVEPVVAAAVRRAADALSREAEVSEVDLPESETFVAVGFDVLLPEATAWHLPFLEGDAEPPYEQGILASLRSGLDIPAVRYLAALEARRRLIRAHEHLFGSIDVLLTPATPYAAPIAAEAGYTWPDGTTEPLETSMCRFTAGPSVTGWPAVTVPVGPADALPVGIQLVGRPGRETDVLEAASRVEEPRLAGGPRTGSAT